MIKSQEGAGIPLWRTLENSLLKAGQTKKYEQQFHTKRRRTNIFTNQPALIILFIRKRYFVYKPQLNFKPIKKPGSG
ncbi:MAG: hypothetical protein D5R98_00775 [Desulfonatronovibrio sp. MSAO_Bac4]|nr:MAG: hypothetical protein D5R98_00775 [Desulfonatronovibrio sp. MSAO_Bac4]